jgi:triacylglycerol lipase
MNIVLAHGILGFSHLDGPLSPVEYFSGTAEFLRQRFQAAVIAPAVDPTAGIETRSAMLRSSIEAALSSGQLRAKDPIHIIAHSMGGLDARRMICKGTAIAVNGEQTPIQTLATIGTPHLGTPVADLVALQFLNRIPLLAGAVQQPEAALANVLAHFRISLDGLHDLTSASAHNFNLANPNQSGVNYLSFAGGGRPGLVRTCNFFLPYYEFIKAHGRGREDSDGMVPVSSAIWGTFDSNLWPADHADEIGHNLDLPLGAPGADALQRYAQIVQRF